MGSFEELSNLLRGGQIPSADGSVPAGGQGGQQGKPDGSGKGPSDAPGLNQLSDVAEKMEEKVPSEHLAPPSAPATRGPMSQDPLIDATVPLQFQQPSQPDIPPPVLPESQNAQQPVSILPGMVDDDKGGFMAANPMMLLQPDVMASIMGSFNDWTNAYAILPQSTEEDPNTAGGGKRSQGKKQTRRGPMDEMRQLVRILVKIFPQSICLINSGDEAGGGNRISEEQIKSYLERTLGEAPRPTWGVPYGWNAYLAELFSWATGKTITPEDSKRVAKREPGRSWEALESEMAAIGVHPQCWPLPLSLDSVREAQRNPVPQPVPIVLPTKRPSEEGGATAAGGTSGTAAVRRTKTSDRDLEKMSEEQLWKHIMDALNVAYSKPMSSDPTIVSLKLNAKTRMDEIFGSLSYPSYVMPAVDPALMQQLLQNMPTSQFSLPSLEGIDLQQVSQSMAAGMAGMALDPQQLQQLQQQMQQQQQQMQMQMQMQLPQQMDDERAAKRARGEGGEAHPGGATGDDEAEKRQSGAGKMLTSSEARGTLFGALGGDARTQTQQAAGFTTLPLQPPLNVGSAYAALSIPQLNALAAGGVLPAEGQDPNAAAK